MPVAEQESTSEVKISAGRFRFLNSPLLLIAVWLLFFSPALFLNRIFYFRDLFFFHYPLRHYWISGLFAGHWPFLNAGLNGGHPILSNPNYAVFYPGNLLYLLLPFDTAWNFSLAGHVLWAAFGVYWLSRILKCTQVASLSGAMVFAFGGPFLSSMTYHNLLVAGSWFPWIALLCIQSWNKGGKWVPWAAVAIAMQFLAGEPTIEMITFLAIIPGWIYALWRSDLRAKQGAKIILILALAMMLVGIQLLPLLEWLPETQRGRGLPFRLSAAYWSLHPARLLEFLVPHFHGNVMGIFVQDFWGEKYSDSGYPYILKVYCGWFPIILMPLAFRRPWGKPAVFVVLAGLILSLGHRLPGYQLLYDLLPPFRVIRYPEKFLLMALMGFAVVTSLALGGIRNKRDLIPSLVTGMILLFGLLILAFTFPHSNLTEAQRHIQIGAIRQSAAFGILTLSLLYLLTIPRFVGAVRWVIPFVIMVDLAAVTWEIPETHQREMTVAKPDILQKFPELQKIPILHLGEDQVDVYFSGNIEPIHFMQDVVHPLTGLSWGVTYGATNDIDRMGWWKSSVRQQQIFNKFPSPESFETMRRAGIGRILSLKPLKNKGFTQEKIYQGSHSLPVYIYSHPQIPLVRWDQSNGKIAWQELAPYRIDFQIEAPKAGGIVIGRNAIKGWEAFEDGRKTTISEAEEGWLHLKTETGTHRFVVIYRPPGLTSGIVMTIFGILLLGTTFLFSKRFS